MQKYDDLDAGIQAIRTESYNGKIGAPKELTGIVLSLGDGSGFLLFF